MQSVEQGTAGTRLKLAVAEYPGQLGGRLQRRDGLGMALAPG
jgi:hypothetical protein